MAHVFVLGGLAESLVNFRGPLIADMIAAGYRVTAAASGPAPEVERQLRAKGVEYCASPAQTGRDRSPGGSALLPCSAPLPAAGSPHGPVGLHGEAGYIWSSRRQKRRGATRPCSGDRAGLCFHGTGRPASACGRLGCAALVSPCAGQMRYGSFSESGRSSVVSTERSFGSRGSQPCRERFRRRSGFFRCQAFARGAPVFLLVARLLRDKGIAEYVDAARLLKGKYPTARFHLVGPLDPNPAAISRAQIDNWSREGVIDYFGSTTDVRPYIAGATVYVLPSYREGTPRSVLEAMSMGRPVVTTDVPGCRETVRHQLQWISCAASEFDGIGGCHGTVPAKPGLGRRNGAA